MIEKRISLLTTSAVFVLLMVLSRRHIIDHELVTISNLIRLIPIMAMTVQVIILILSALVLCSLLYRTGPWLSIILRRVFIIICIDYGLSCHRDIYGSHYSTGVLATEELFFLRKAGAAISHFGYTFVCLVMFWFVSLHRKFPNLLFSFPLRLRIETPLYLFKKPYVRSYLLDVGVLYCMVILLKVAFGHWINARKYGQCQVQNTLIICEHA